VQALVGACPGNESEATGARQRIGARRTRTPDPVLTSPTRVDDLVALDVLTPRSMIANHHRESAPFTPR
jgi:hypothetical protein